MVRFIFLLLSLTLIAASGALEALSAIEAGDTFSMILPEDFRTSRFFSTSGDFVVVTSSNASVLVFKLVDGYYEMTDTRNAKGLQGLASIYGNWIGMSFAGLQQIYQIDASGKFQDKYYNLTTADNIQGKFMPDGAYVVLTKSGIRTYTFSEANGWTLYRTDVPSNYNSLTSGQKLLFLDGCVAAITIDLSGGYSMRADLVFRSENQTWTTTTQFRFYVQNFFNIEFHEASETLVFLFPQYPNAVFAFYNKVHHHWSNIQNISGDAITPADLNQNSAIMSFINQDNLIVGVPAEVLSANSYLYGAIYWLKRNEEGQWNPYVRVSRDFHTNTPTVFALSPIPTTGNNFIAMQCSGEGNQYTALDCVITTVETCLLDPTNVTCQDVINIASCTDYDFNITDYYTVNTPQRCGAITARYTDIRTKSDQISVDLGFSRNGVKDVTCTIVLSCPALPSAAPVAGAPIDVSKSVSGATSLVVPALLLISASLSWALL